MKENKNMWQVDNLPNRLTIMRMILVPIFIGMCLCGIYFPENGKSFYTWAGITFITAAITDFLDGYIARKKNLVTHFGSFLDPIADKFLVTSALIMLLSAGKIHVIIVVVLILREVFITALRSFALQNNVKIEVGIFGKIKTIFQLVGLPFLILSDGELWNPLFAKIGIILLVISILFSLVSAGEYVLKLIQKLKLKNNLLS